MLTGEVKKCSIARDKYRPGYIMCNEELKEEEEEED